MSTELLARAILCREKNGTATPKESVVPDRFGSINLTRRGAATPPPPPAAQKTPRPARSVAQERPDAVADDVRHLDRRRAPAEEAKAVVDRRRRHVRLVDERQHAAVERLHRGPERRQHVRDVG